MLKSKNFRSKIANQGGTVQDPGPAWPWCPWRTHWPSSSAVQSPPCSSLLALQVTSKHIRRQLLLLLLYLLTTCILVYICQCQIRWLWWTTHYINIYKLWYNKTVPPSRSQFILIVRIISAKITPNQLSRVKQETRLLDEWQMFPIIYYRHFLDLWSPQTIICRAYAQHV